MKWIPSIPSPALAAFVALAVAFPAFAQVPGRVAFQGLLTDSAGLPLTQTVTLDFELFDAETGGTSLWSETQAGVQVVDGLYDVELGSVTPIGPAVLAGAAVFLEIRVDAEILTPRKRLLAVPYALKAQEAETVGAVEAAVISQIWLHANFDGGDPPNDDPLEGLLDSDNDGVANFLESDNDDDGLSDVDELANGTSVNDPTPIITSVAPGSGAADVTTRVTVTGSSFFFGDQTVTVGGFPFPPLNATSTSFELDIGPFLPAVYPIVVTDPSGDSAMGSFELTPNPPVLTGFSPLNAPTNATTVVTVTGSNFQSGFGVQFGSETPTPVNVTPTSFDVSVGPQGAGAASVVITNPNGETASGSFQFVDPNSKVAFLSSASGNAASFGGVSGADALCQLDATNAGLSGTFLAWIATSGADAPNSRFVQSSTPYIRPDGLLIADDYADLVDGDIEMPINLDASGAVLGGQVWTAVDEFGAATNLDCNDWTAASGFTVSFGDSSQTDKDWTRFLSAPSCASSRRLYCFEQ